METTRLKPMTMAELLPGLNGILSKDALQSLTAKKQPRSTIAQTLTSEKVMKPMTIAEIRANILAVKVQSSQKYSQGAPSNKKKTWNSSVKLENKTVSCTANRQMKHNPAKKMLNFQSKPAVNLRATMMTESPKFPKPELRVKKSLALHARNNVRISGISNLAETPVVRKPVKNKMMLANKENISKPFNIKKVTTPKPINNKKVNPLIPDTPLSNESWKSSCDASFLQKEKEINDIEEKNKAIAEERTLENIAEVTPPISTPFKEYRSVQDYFNNSNDLNNSAIYNDNTIMCFDNPSNSKEVIKREESVIVSLCDLFNKASVTTNTEKMSTELEDLLLIEKQAEYNIRMIEKSIFALSDIKESQLKSLTSVRKLINEKKGLQIQGNPLTDVNKTLIETKETPKAVKIDKVSPEKSSIISKPCSVIKSSLKSPTYKIPKKNLCLRKKVFYKSMPNVSSEMSTPLKADMGNRALSVYMKMKEHLNFLNTPNAKQQYADIPDTPGVTSRNLQKQLDKLYCENYEF